MLFIMRGASCSGKSRFVQKYFGQTPSAIIESDHYRKVLFGTPYCQTKNRELFDHIKQIIEHRFASMVGWTVLDATNLKISDTYGVMELCKRFHQPYTFISIRPPSLDVLIERNTDRAKFGGLNVPEKVFQKHLARYDGCRNDFVKEARGSVLCTWIELDQQHEVIDHVCI